MGHLLVFPALNGSIDFERQEQDVCGVWYRAPMPQWISILIPKITAAAQSGDDITFSTWRQNFGFTSPDNYVLPAGDNFQVRLFAPMGPPFDADNWGCVTFFNSRRPPTDSGRFIVSGGGLRLQLDTLLNQAFIDSMRQIGSRPRLEIWVRHKLRMCDIAPGVHSIPAIMQATIGLSHAEAAAKVDAMRRPTSNADWYAKRRRDQEAQQHKEAEEQAADEKLFEERRQAWLKEHGEDGAEPAEIFAARSIAQDQLLRSAESISHVGPQEAQAPALPQPERTQRELAAEGRRKVEKGKKIARNAVEAAKRDKANAEAHAKRVIERMQKEGRL